MRRYKQTFSRTYADDVEEAVRKNVFIQSSRHVESGNRQGASFEMQNNFLSDRLKVERRVMGGVAPSDSAEFGDSFPHSRAELNATRGRLPNEFDWRKLGGVTPVRCECVACLLSHTNEDRGTLVTRILAHSSGYVPIVLGLCDGGRSGRRAVQNDRPSRGA